MTSARGNYEMFLLVGLFEGVGKGFMWSPLMVLLSEIVSPRLREIGIGIYRTFVQVGSFIGPLLFMFLYSTVGSHETFFLAIIIFAGNITAIMNIKRGTVEL